MESLEILWRWKNEIHWLSNNFLLMLGLFSITLLITSLLGCIWAIILLPPDYFSRPKQPETTFTGILRRIVKNILGIFVFIAGIVMLVLPGPGLLMMFIGMLFIDFPRKEVIVKKFIGHSYIFKSLNRIRRKYRKDHFIHPDIQ